MCSDPCVEKNKKGEFNQTFFTWINVLHIYVRTVKIYLLKVPWHNTEKVILIKLLVV